MTVAHPGWTLAADAAPEAPCPGSGQTAAPWAPARVACPACGRILARDPYAGTLPDHYADADGARPLELWTAQED